MTELKYQSQIETIADCPCCKERIPEKIYRFVKNVPLDYSDFIPVAIEKPNKVAGYNNSKKCLHHGLSVFDSLTNALLRYESFNDNLKLIKGFKYIAEGNLKTSDGIIHRSTATKGHLTFYEGRDIELLSKFELVKELS